MNNYLPSDYQSFIHTSRYARWLDKEQRRETWPETVDRYIDNIVAPVLADDTTMISKLREAILSLQVMPSMRALMTAGITRDNTCFYNCAYVAIDDPKAFDETMFILLNGTGVGFSCERQYIQKLPEIPAELNQSETTIVVQDSKEGWAKSYRQLIALLYAGEIPQWDTGLVRPAGARLKTFGGRASGPAPLVDLFTFTIEVFKGAAGRKLTSIEVHDICCKIAEIVVVGGVRRSAMISLSNLSDDRMRHAKTGQFPSHRYLANNSVAYTEKPDAQSFLREWSALADSGSGERGIFNRQAAAKQAAKYGRRDPSKDYGCNPCSEVILQNGQFCNLSEIIVRATDTANDIRNKTRLATILGTIQSTYTKFPYLRKVWTKNTEAERLLGVSMTGIMDNVLTNGKEGNLPQFLEELRQIAVETNEALAEKLGIPQSAAITCVKPSGTVSQLVSCASGIHARFAPYYIRTVRGDNKDPLTQFMADQGVPCEPCVYKPDQTTVFSFPIASPQDAVMTTDMTAVEQLEMWLTYQRHFAEHKPSVTINVQKDEWMEVGAFVYEHFDEMSGVSFLPFDDHVYQQAPYQPIGKSEYDELVKLMPGKIDWSKLQNYEKEDTTVSMQTLSCTGDTCEFVDIGAA